MADSTDNLQPSRITLLPVPPARPGHMPRTRGCLCPTAWVCGSEMVEGARGMRLSTTCARRPRATHLLTRDLMFDAVPYSSPSILLTRAIISLGGMISEIMDVPFLLSSSHTSRTSHTAQHPSHQLLHRRVSQQHILCQTACALNPKRTSAGCKQSQPRTANSPALLALVFRHALDCFLLPCGSLSLLPARVCRTRRGQKTGRTNSCDTATAAHPLS